MVSSRLVPIVLVSLILITTFSSAAPLDNVPIDIDDFHNSTASEVFIIYPLSGVYAPLQRALYWAIIFVTLIGYGNIWLVTAAFGTAMTYSAVAAVHGIVIYAVRSHEYYDADALAIWEIIYCTYCLLPLWRTHFHRLRSTTMQVVLHLWGILMFIGGVFILLQLKFNAHVVAQRNDCVTQLPSDTTAFDMVDWHSQTACAWQPYENATQPMRDINDIIIVRSSDQLATLMGRPGTLSFILWIIFLCLLFICTLLFWFESSSLEKKRHKHAKNIHLRITYHMPIAWVFGIVGTVFGLVLSEISLHPVPVSEGPSSVSQWGTWVSLCFVLVGALVNHYREAPIWHKSTEIELPERPEWKRKEDVLGREHERAMKEAEEGAVEGNGKAIVRAEETQMEEMQTKEMPTKGTQPKNMETVPSERPKSEAARSRRFSESDIGFQHVVGFGVDWVRDRSI